MVDELKFGFHQSANKIVYVKSYTHVGFLPYGVIDEKTKEDLKLNEEDNQQLAFFRITLSDDSSLDLIFPAFGQFAICLIGGTIGDDVAGAIAQASREGLN